MVDCTGVKPKEQADGHELSSNNVREQPPFKGDVFGVSVPNRNQKSLYPYRPYGVNWGNGPIVILALVS